MKYVAFLRGIAPTNPNMRQQKLCGVLESVGMHNVRGVISSGNVVFESDSTDIPALESMLEKAWPAQLGFNSTTIIKSQIEPEELVACDPFKGLEHGSKTYLLVTFFKASSKIHADPISNFSGSKYIAASPHNGALFSVIDTTGAKTPDLMSKLERQFGKEITSRTWKTVLRVLEKMKK